MKVLAVDDDATILALLKEALALVGFEDVVTVGSGEEALGCLAGERVPFDCILLDIQMPGMDGITLCREIRARRGYARVPILMLTAMSQRDYIERAFAAGATDYVTKPFDFLELGSRLRLAHRLVQERNLVTDGQIALEALRREMDTTLKLALNQPVELTGVDRTISYLSFENYILQLSRGSQFTSSAYAVQIRGIEDIHASVSGAQFRTILTGVARAISDATAADGTILTYRGLGLFLCVTHARARNDRADLAQRVQAALLPADQGGRAIRIEVGERVSLGSLTRFGPLQALHRAIGLPDRRLKADTAQPVPQGDDPAPQNRFAFEAMLRETLTEDLPSLRG